MVGSSPAKISSKLPKLNKLTLGVTEGKIFFISISLTNTATRGPTESREYRNETIQRQQTSVSL